MIKVSSSLYKMPYYNVETQTLKSVNRLKDDYQEIVCVCGGTCDNNYGGQKYSFKYQANPTIEPVSYRLKGWSQDASLNYNDVGIDAESSIMAEVNSKITQIGDKGIEPNILNYKQNDFNNWQLSDKIFQRVKSLIYKFETYSELAYYDTFVPVFTISSEIYTVNIQQSIVHQ